MVEGRATKITDLYSGNLSKAKIMTKILHSLNLYNFNSPLPFSLSNSTFVIMWPYISHVNFLIWMSLWFIPNLTSLATYECKILNLHNHGQSNNNITYQFSNMQMKFHNYCTLVSILHALFEQFQTHHKKSYEPAQILLFFWFLDNGSKFTCHQAILYIYILVDFIHSK